MAKVSMSLPEEFLLRVSRLAEKTDVILPKVLEAGGEVVLEQVRSNLRAVVGRGTKYPSRSTGELVRALGLSPPKVDREGTYNVKVGFKEPRSDRGSNAKLANILEYGKHGQPARPFLKPARTSTKAACVAAMTAMLNEEIAKL